jgi:hypothetical protein
VWAPAVCHCGKPIVSGILGHNWWPMVPRVMTPTRGFAHPQWHVQQLPSSSSGDVIVVWMVMPSMSRVLHELRHRHSCRSSVTMMGSPQLWRHHLLPKRLLLLDMSCSPCLTSGRQKPMQTKKARPAPEDDGFARTKLHWPDKRP